MPPSAEGLSKPPAKSRAERRSQARKKGKQPGSPGTHLAQVTDPDSVCEISPPTCRSCGADLEDSVVVGEERRQVFELPDIRLQVTEHVAKRRRCRCGEMTTATFAPHVTAPACYGPKLRALAVYLLVYQHLPYDRTARLFGDLLGQPVSVGTLQNMVREASEATGPFIDKVRSMLRDADCVHFDETGGRVEGRLHWIHGASDSLLTLLTCHTKRGRQAFDDMGVISHMSGIAVHDGFRPYQGYDVIHSLCNAHHLRELAAVEKPWADDLALLLIAAKIQVQDAKADGRSALVDERLRLIRDRYKEILFTAWMELDASEKTPKGAQSKEANLICRLASKTDDVLRFCADFRAPFDNNQAERDIRMVKLQQKISGSWRSFGGAQSFLSVRSYVSTLRKNDRDILTGLGLLFDGHAWLPGGT